MNKMKIPQIIQTNEDRVKYLYRVLELLRLEHNKKGQEFREGKITEKEFREYQKGEHREKTAKIFADLNPIKDKLGMFEMLKGNKLQVKEDDPRLFFKEQGEKEIKWDKDIDLTKI